MSESIPVALRITPRQGNLYAVAGEKSYCENGHLLGVFRKDAPMGKIPTDELLAVGQMRIAAIGCPYCGGKSNVDGYYYFAATPVSAQSISAKEYA